MTDNQQKQKKKKTKNSFHQIIEKKNKKEAYEWKLFNGRNWWLWMKFKNVKFKTTKQQRRLLAERTNTIISTKAITEQQYQKNMCKNKKKISNSKKMVFYFILFFFCSFTTHHHQFQLEIEKFTSLICFCIVFFHRCSWINRIQCYEYMICSSITHT